MASSSLMRSRTFESIMKMTGQLIIKRGNTGGLEKYEIDRH